MPDLPTITVTQGQYDRLLEVFPGTPAEKAQAYRQLVRDTLKTYVINSRIRTINEEENAAAQVRIDAEIEHPDNI